MKDVILALCVLFGGALWCYSILDLMFFHTWVSLMGIWSGAALFLISWSEINEKNG